MKLRIRHILKSCAVFFLGSEAKPRIVISGLAAGYRISISPAEHFGYLVGTADGCLQEGIKRFVRIGDTVYDIGANLGYISLMLAKRVGPKGRVIAFEPVPETFELLQRNLALNKVRNVELFNVAASDKSGEAVIRMTDNLSESSMVWHRNEPSATELSVKTVAIDNLVQRGEIALPTFVKIDVEGAEGLALRGMSETISHARPVLFVECSDIGREVVWPLLRNLGYQCRSTVTGRYVTTFDEYRHADFLWIPPDRAY